MILIYRVLTYFLYPFLFIFLYYRVLLKKEDPKRFKEKILASHFNIKKNDNLKLIWFHAASVGELRSIIPIISQINNKNYEILITTVTISSSNLAKKELEEFDNIQHRFLPFDVDFLIKKFVTLWKPDKIFLVDSEIWPNLILIAHQKKIPIALINARLTLKSFNRWLLFRRTAQKIFSKLELCLCSNKETKIFLENLKVKKVKYVGNLKFISNKNQNKEFSNLNAQKLLKSRFWVAASIHKEEDVFCLNTHIILKKKFKDIITIIAPRHIERCHKIKLLSEKFNLNTQVLNANSEILDGKEIIIINSFGVLHNFFLYAKSVFIGKSIIKRFKEDGGQNPIDAARLNCKVYHGPYVSNFDEIYEILKNNKASSKIENVDELSENLINDLIESKKTNNKNNSYLEALEKNISFNTKKIIEDFLHD